MVVLDLSANRHDVTGAGCLRILLKPGKALSDALSLVAPALDDDIINDDAPDPRIRLMSKDLAAATDDDALWRGSGTSTTSAAPRPPSPAAPPSTYCVNAPSVSTYATTIIGTCPVTSSLLTAHATGQEIGTCPLPSSALTQHVLIISLKFRGIFFDPSTNDARPVDASIACTDGPGMSIARKEGLLESIGTLNAGPGTSIICKDGLLESIGTLNAGPGTSIVCKEGLLEGTGTLNAGQGTPVVCEGAPSEGIGTFVKGFSAPIAYKEGLLAGTTCSFVKGFSAPIAYKEGLLAGTACSFVQGFSAPIAYKEGLLAGTACSFVKDFSALIAYKDGFIAGTACSFVKGLSAPVARKEDLLEGIGTPNSIGTVAVGLYTSIACRHVTSGTIHLTCVGVIKTIESLIADYPLQAGRAIEFPTLADGSQPLPRARIHDSLHDQNIPSPSPSAHSTVLFLDEDVPAVYRGRPEAIAARPNGGGAGRRASRPPKALNDDSLSIQDVPTTRRDGHGCTITAPMSSGRLGRTDSQTVLDGTHCERRGKSSRWLASRRAMIRAGEERGTIDPRKLDGAEMVADIVTEALAGTVFKKHRTTILGLSHAPLREDWSKEAGA